MKREAFEQLIEDAVASIPERFRKRFDNLAFIVEDEARRGGRHATRIKRGSILLGLYEGVPLARRGVNYSLVLPDTITIFQQPIEQLARGRTEMIRAIVRDTVLHEVAHHLGFDELEVRRWERKRREKH